MFDRLILLDRTKVLFGVGSHLVGGQKRHVKVSRCEAEYPAVVLPHDRFDIVRAGLANGAPHAGDTMIVGGDRQRPRLQNRIVVLQERGGRLARCIRIAPLIDDMIDLHEATSGVARELPQAGGADVRTRFGVIRRFDMRQ